MPKATLTARSRSLLEALAASGGNLIELFVWRPYGHRIWCVTARAAHLSRKDNIHLSLDFVVRAYVPHDSVEDEDRWSEFEGKVERAYEWLRDHYPGTVRLVYAIRNGQPYPVQRKKRKSR